MVILIGGVGYAGKTYMAQQLLEKYHYPYLSIDHLKMGLYRASIGCGFTPQDSIEQIGEALWPILKGIIMTNIENEQNIIIEGAYLLPDKINALDESYHKHIISFYLCFSEVYIQHYFETKVLHYRCAIEARGYENSDTIADYIADNQKQKHLCEKYDARFFEIQDDYHEEMNAVYDWIDRMVAAQSLRS